ncbi:diguanylate cyclase (GGDEF)-like protein [Anaerobacterium chartisolvens]|uniref:Stage 0 sporulation protein A homolog n=1 Tax=Anaerobacterium chartisolvens TaxID=1297424 RepID=A0A369BB91_9FIRM|nr:diguanylate cyclase [Anaerobacterium chartisolvens]RCX18793.1 diguanylate cyclase (GGDEF)-like protein [Anaerobacterium chartisolvens]
MLKNKETHILVIDPHSIPAGKLSRHLSGIGYTTSFACTPDAARELMSSSLPDIIIIDILMEDENGKGLMPEISNAARPYGIPIIVLSSSNDIDAKTYAFAWGASDYILKPFSFRELTSRINVHLKTRGRHNELKEKVKKLTARNTALKKMALTDTLTGLYNRNYIAGSLHITLARSIRSGEPISFIMADIDFFKTINDTYGHQTGDCVIRDASKIIKHSVRESDIVARYGGEEFLIVCPITEASGARKISERIRSNIDSNTFICGDHSIHITISLGIRSMALKQGTKTDIIMNKLIKEADMALYKAKFKGRNRVEVFIL